ncbi:complement C1q-like protein 4 [Menidia menidia]|uniref:(Atlantic silverside) hypothetical protein n=1 Tax=Menidia menidia TaxID=238744 RepID=A0A8S4BLM6_9TELE|nr:unnamed protein product [Menidia menidia]
MARVNMRAIVLLCLLHTASTNNLFSWDGPGRAAPEPGSDAGSACSTDKSSCGCCLMVRKTNQMKTYFDTTLTELENEFMKANQSLHTMKESRVAFTVSLYGRETIMCHGPFRDNRIVTYKDVLLNYGGAYNTSSGIFTVPHSGVYSLTVTIYSDAGSPGNMLAACATLQVNGKAVAGARDFNPNDQEDSATIVLALHLKAGDKVSVELTKGCFLCDDSSHYNTFSAFLLYLTE